MSDAKEARSVMNEIVESVEKEKQTREEIERDQKERAAIKAQVTEELLGDKVSKAELAVVIKELRKENADLRTMVLKAKAQGKAHFESEEQSDLGELEKIYGKDSRIIQTLRH